MSSLLSLSLSLGLGLGGLGLGSLSLSLGLLLSSRLVCTLLLLDSRHRRLLQRGAVL